MKKAFFLSLAFSGLALTGCGDSSSSSPDHIDLTEYTAVIVETDSGSEVGLADAGNLSNITEGYYPSAETDYFTASHDGYFWYIGKSTIDVISKYAPSSPNANYYGSNGYSLLDNGQTTSSNVYAMGFLSDERAILTRYGQTSAWIVDTDAANADDFKVGEIDLSAYVAADDTASPAPEMNNIAIHDNKAFIPMERLGDDQGNKYAYARSAYVAVINTASFEEIDTDPTTDGLKGIELNILNPRNIAAEGNDLYVQGITYGRHNSGLVKINMDTYAQEMLYDSSVSSTEISDVAVAGGKVFVVIYNAWKDNALAVVNADGSLTKVDEFSDIFIEFITTGPAGNLWLGRGNKDDSASAVFRISPADYSVLDSVETNLDPINVSFVKNSATDINQQQ